jgi:hypothetical protein
MVLLQISRSPLNERTLVGHVLPTVRIVTKTTLQILIIFSIVSLFWMLSDDIAFIPVYLV